MSLINDALKRAKQAQHEAPARTTPEPQFRPVEPGQVAGRSYGPWAGIGLAVVAVVLVIGAFLWFRKPANNAPTEPAPPAQAVAAAAPAPPSASGSTAPAASKPSLIAEPTSAANTQPAAAPEPLRQSNPAAQPVPAAAPVQTSQRQIAFHWRKAGRMALGSH